MLGSSLVTTPLFETAAIELINSRLPGGDDQLDDPEWLARALERWHLTARNPDLAELRRLRTVLRQLAASISARGTVSADDVAELNRQLSRAPVRTQLELSDGGLLLDVQPVAGVWADRAATELAGSFASILRSASPPRVKVCVGCGRCFYDGSRNRSRRWCDSRACGNRERVRRHRARAAATE